MKVLFKGLFVLAITILIAGCKKAEMETKKPSDLESKMKRFAPVEITADISKLTEGDQKALAKLFEASRVLDKIYTRQVWSGNEALRQKLEADHTSEGLQRLKYFNINMSPWSIIDHDEAFIEGIPRRPAYANYYPEDMTKEEFTAWVEKLPEAEKQKATGFFYTVRRDANRKLTLVPYNEEYKDLLEPAAKFLREAAELTTDSGLRVFLIKRADALLSNDYYASDLAWMELEGPIEPTIGPYEVYMDDLFNYKAAFEAFITLRNDEETKKLATFSKNLQDIENNLPINPKYRNPKLGASAPIRDRRGRPGRLLHPRLPHA